MAPNSKQNGVVVAKFELFDPAYPFVGLSEAESCRLALQKMLPRGSGRYAEFFSVLGADPDRILELAESSDSVTPTLVRRYDDGGLYEFLVEAFCPARDLAERGAIPREVIGEEGRGEITAEILPDADPARVIRGFLEANPDAELCEKRVTDRRSPLFTNGDLERAMDERLTERQREVLETAFQTGYYDPVKATTGADLAVRLGISAPTVSQHLRAAECKLITILFEDRLSSPMTPP